MNFSSYISIMTAGGPGSGCRGDNCGRPEGATTGLKAAQLRARWASLNNALLPHIDHPDDPHVKAIMQRMRTLVREMYHVAPDEGTEPPEKHTTPTASRDLVVIGAGPGGMAAAIMGATDGLKTTFVDAQVKPGGQAKFSSRIENFPGFPVGVTGERLAKNMYTQATRLGAEGKMGVAATGIDYDSKTGLKTVHLANGESITARSVVLAGGVEFKRMEFPGSDSNKVIYGDGKALTRASAGKPVVVVGGSNGAAQAALGAATKASRVYLLARHPIADSMSDYQVQALRVAKNVEVIEGDEIAKLWTDEHGKSFVSTKNGRKIAAAGVGVFVGSQPKTDWLPEAIGRENGKIAVDGNLETKMPGVFAVGDMRVGSIGRIGAAVGDGQMAERNVFSYFNRTKEKTQ